MLASLAWMGDPAGGPQPPGIPDAWRTPAKLALLAVAAAGFALGRRRPCAGGLVAVGAGAALGVAAALEYHPAVAAPAAVVIIAPAALLAWTGARGAWVRATVAGVGAALLVAGAGGASSLHGLLYGATHPASDVAGPPSGGVEWVWSGGIQADEAVVVAKLADGGGAAGLLVSPAAGVAQAARRGPVVRFRLSGLRPGTSYRYAVTAGGREDGSGRGRLRTLPRGPASFTIAFSSCARTGSNGAVFDAIRAEDPLLYLNTGDMYYANIESNEPERFRDAYDRVLTRPAQANLFRAAGSVYVWDDHDYGGNDSDATSPSGPAAHRVFREYVPHHPLALAGRDAPLARAFTIGRVRVLVTDTRSARSPKGMRDGPGKTMLGAAQRAWLERELVAANGRFPVIVWANPNPWIGATNEGSDTWSGYTHERRAIAEMIARNRIRGLVMISGDNHATAVDDGTNTGYATGGGGAFPLIHAGALDRFPQSKGGPYSHGEFPGGGQYGTMRIVDTGGRDVTVVLTGKDWRRRTLTSLRIRMVVGSRRVTSYFPRINASR